VFFWMVQWLYRLWFFLCIGLNIFGRVLVLSCIFFRFSKGFEAWCYTSIVLVCDFHVWHFKQNMYLLSVYFDSQNKPPEILQILALSIAVTIRFSTLIRLGNTGLDQLICVSLNQTKHIVSNPTCVQNSKPLPFIFIALHPPLKPFSQICLSTTIASRNRDKVSLVFWNLGFPFPPLLFLKFYRRIVTVILLKFDL